MASGSRSPVAVAALAAHGPGLSIERLSDRLAARLIAQIDQGALRPGDRLPTEAQLAVSHGVSRSVVREAVHRVKSRGLLVSRQGSGVYVAPPLPHQPLAFDPSVLESMTAVVQVVELRRVLEGEIAALAAQRATRAQTTGLKRALAAIDAATDAGLDGVDEDLAFHRAIGAATGNPQFTRLLAFLEQYLREAMRVTKGNEARRADFMRQVRDEHRAIVDGIAARDPDAARAAAIQHLHNGEWRLVEGGMIARPARRRRAATA
ncbi:MAG: FadR family transcriptional regulator [Rhizobacter sp.]|nr:FadR family transcriptional regulator [Rhizobacter sp.]